LGIIAGLAFSIIYSVAAFGFGWAADRGIRRNIIAAGLLVWSAATAASGLAQGFGTLFAARFFTGVGEASLYPAAMSLVAERFGVAERGKAMGIFAASAAVGSALATGVGGLLAETVGWRGVFFIYGGAGVLVLPILFSFPEERRPPDRHDRDGHALAVVSNLLRDRRLLALWSTGMVMIAAALGYGSWIPSFFVRERGMGVTEAGYLIAVAALIGGGGGGLLGGYLADRRRRLKRAGELEVSALAALVAAPAVVLTVWIEPLSLFAFFAVAAPVAIYAFFPPTQTVLVELVPARNHGLAYAINIFFLGGVGSAIGPLLVGYGSDASASLKTAMWIPVAGMAAAAVMAWATGVYIRSRWRGEGGGDAATETPAAVESAPVV
jgi:MFS family permease